MYILIFLIQIVTSQLIAPPGVLSIFNHMNNLFNQGPNRPRIRGFSQRIYTDAEGHQHVETHSFGDQSNQPFGGQSNQPFDNQQGNGMPATHIGGIAEMFNEIQKDMQEDIKKSGKDQKKHNDQKKDIQELDDDDNDDGPIIIRIRPALVNSDSFNLEDFDDDDKKETQKQDNHPLNIIGFGQRNKFRDEEDDDKQKDQIEINGIYPQNKKQKKQGKNQENKKKNEKISQTKTNQKDSKKDNFKKSQNKTNEIELDKKIPKQSNNIDIKNQTKIVKQNSKNEIKESNNYQKIVQEQQEKSLTQQVLSYFEDYKFIGLLILFVLSCFYLQNKFKKPNKYNIQNDMSLQGINKSD